MTVSHHTLPHVRLGRLAIAAACLAGGLTSSAAGAERLRADLVVFDSTPAGITAAIAASRAGRSALIVSEWNHVGGMQTSGLGNTNAGQRATVGGLAREFHERVLRWYRDRHGADSAQVGACEDGFRFEPHAALEVYRDWLAEAGVRCLDGEAVAGVRMAGKRIAAIRTEGGREIEGTVFVDASYEGDLLAMAGCSFRVGREGADEHGESLAGLRLPPEHAGQADDKIQPNDYRLCLTDVAANRVPFREPSGYDRAAYGFLAARMAAEGSADLREFVPLNLVPNRKTDSRTAEWVGQSWTYPTADRAERRRLDAAHRAYAEGWLWFLLTDMAVPASIRAELSRWGYARDEFVDNGHWPYRLYVRQGRRLVGDFVMTQRDVTSDRFKPDGVAIGSYFLDVHPVQFLTAADQPGGLVPEGSLGKQPLRPYEIPYRALLPRRTEVENLLVPVGMSASHVAYSTLRMEPVYMMLGHACGCAAVLAMDKSLALHDVPQAALRGVLAAQGQVLDARPFTETWPRTPPR